MASQALIAENLGKRYTIGGLAGGYGRLTETLTHLAKTSFGRQRRDAVPDPTSFWALRNVSFSVGEGEVVGVIGRNGAGKTTLLKLLARITAPTEGRAEIHGRIGSLLEVGTGFHPELTGNENILLNGAIMGMSRREIRSKFSTIVEFAEIEQFLDTPVKRYSSGMYMRLAFAVAAHLDPEILLVDEVLAVGDARFREKCLRRMGEVSKEGRTVFFVSHDLNAILSTCSRALLIDHGTLLEDGAVEDVASTYQSGAHGAAPADGLFVRQRPHPRFPVPVFLSVQVQTSIGGNGIHAAYGDPLRLVIETNSGARVPDFGVDVRILDRRQRPISYLSSVEMRGRYFRAGDLIDCIIPALPFVPGTYTVDLMAHVPGIEPLDHWGGEISFEIVRFDPYGVGSTFHPTDETGSVVPAHDWQAR